MFYPEQIYSTCDTPPNLNPKLAIPRKIFLSSPALLVSSTLPLQPKPKLHTGEFS